MQKDKIQGKGPYPGLGDSPEQEVSAESSSHCWVGKAVHLQCILAKHAHARCWQCPRHGQEQRRAGTLRSLVARAWKWQHRSTYGAPLNVQEHGMGTPLILSSLGR
ncbi:uncharacterized protein GJ701_017899 isoform 2-T4 [Geothlypis trichas]